MELSEPRPRVNGSMIPSNVGKCVVVVGVAHDVDASGTSFQVTCCDNQNVEVDMQEPLQEHISGLVEVHGQVQSENVIMCHSYVIFGQENTDAFDMESYNKAVTLSQQTLVHYTTGGSALA